MTKKFVEVTIAFDDDPVINPNGTLEVFHREKVDAEAWSTPSETTENAHVSQIGLGFITLDIKKV